MPSLSCITNCFKVPYKVESSAVTTWLKAYDESFNRFQIIANKGLYSILAKEIAKLTPLIKEGRSIQAGHGRTPAVDQAIQELIKPRFLQLQKTFTAAQKTVGTHSKQLKRDVQLEQKWEKLLTDSQKNDVSYRKRFLSVMDKHADCVRFIFDSKLVFSIIGYRETCGNPDMHDIKLDVDDHPLLKMQGQWIRWETIARDLRYHSQSEKIKSRNTPSQAWNYFHPRGLVPIDRFGWQQAYSIYELSPEEYNRTREHALKFYKTNPERDPGIVKDCIVQFFTSPRQRIPKHFLLDNLNRQFPLHIGMRMITSDRKVYSFGYQMSPEETAKLISDPLSNFLMTTKAELAMQDLEEFREHEGRVVTSIPLTSERSQNILSFLNGLSGKQLRFQYERQNCSLMMLEVLKKTGYDIDIRSSAIRFIYEAFPSFNQIPVVGLAIVKVEQCAKRIWAALPNFIRGPLLKTRQIALLIPERIGIVLLNLCSWKLGAAKKTIALPLGVTEEELYDKRGLQNFSCVIRSWADLFKKETSVIYHSKYFLDWQKQQCSTFTDPYTGRPKLSIVPPL